MTVVLIDGRNSLYRYGWVFRHLKTSKGVYTGAIYGFLHLLQRLKKRYSEAKFVVVWEPPEAREGWRKKLYPDYKENRGPVSEDIGNILGQIYLVKDVLKMVGIGQVEIPMFEADDTIGLLALACKKQDWEVVVYSSDEDFLQLMQYGVVVIRDVDKTRNMAPETPAIVAKKYRCLIKDVLKVRSIAGDKSDNIDGAITGVGPVKAAALVAAGVNPSNDVWSTRDGFTSQMKAKMRRNYELMKLVTALDDSRVPQDEMEVAAAVLESTMRQLEGPGKRRDYEVIVTRFMELELQQALADRHEIFGLAG